MTNQIEYHRAEAAIIHKEVLALEEELKLTGVQHKRQAIKTKITERRMAWQIQNLHRLNEELKEDAIKVVMASQVRVAQNTLESAQDSIARAAVEMSDRLKRLAQSIDRNLEYKRYDDLCYNMASELPVILGNSSLDALGRHKGEMLAAQAILAMVDQGKE